MFPPPPFLLSIEATRPVFMIVMGCTLGFVAWRMVRGSTGWAARLILGGALLLAFGYAVLVPLYDARVIARLGPASHHGDPGSALAWHVVKLFAMNAGWLMLGTGLAIHARLFESARMPVTTAKPAAPKPEQASA